MRGVKNPHRHTPQDPYILCLTASPPNPGYALRNRKGHIAPDVMDGHAVVAAYHDLWKVEQSFRMAKSDLKARPIFHRTRESIEAHLTIVFAALAIARYLQNQTGVSIKKIVQALRRIHTVIVDIDGHELTARTPLSDEAQDIVTVISTGH